MNTAFEKYWSQLYKGPTKDILQEAFEAGEQHAQSSRAQGWFNDGFEAGIKAAKDGMINNIQKVNPDSPAIEDWEKERETKKK